MSGRIPPHVATHREPLDDAAMARLLRLAIKLGTQEVIPRSALVNSIPHRVPHSDSGLLAQHAGKLVVVNTG